MGRGLFSLRVFLLDSRIHMVGWDPPPQGLDRWLFRVSSSTAALAGSVTSLLAVFLEVWSGGRLANRPLLLRNATVAWRSAMVCKPSTGAVDFGAALLAR